MAQTTSEYVPGVCNINTAEIAYRKKVGIVGLMLTVVLFALLLALDAPPATRLLLFLPAFIAAIGFLQAQNKFCVAYGAAGKQNATEGENEAKTVADTAAILKDKARVRNIRLQATLIALAVTSIAYII